MSKNEKQAPLFTGKLIKESILQSICRLSPSYQVKNPVMFIVWLGSIFCSAYVLYQLYSGESSLDNTPLWFSISVTVSLWFTVIFANFAESIAEGRGKAHASSLKSLSQDIIANKIESDGKVTKVASNMLSKGDVVRVSVGEMIPRDGEVIEGIAAVDESAITGESAPVIRESGGDRSSVTGGTKVISDSILVRISSDPGGSFLDGMIKLVQGANRQKTPNEIALHILLVGLTIIFLMVCVTIVPIAFYSGVILSPVIIVALLVCLIPTTIGGLVSAIGVAGMERLLRKNVLAVSGKAVEASGDVDVLLLDKTGTITLGNRMAMDIIPMPNVNIKDLARAAELSSLGDETPEGRSIIKYLHDNYGSQAGSIAADSIELIPFTAETRMSGSDFENMKIRKGAVDAMQRYIASIGGSAPKELDEIAQSIGKSGGTPLAVAIDSNVLGIIHLKDIVKPGMRERFQKFRAMGIKTVMITGDNPFTARAIAEEAGVDDFLAEATPEKKMHFIKGEQESGHLVAMTGDGTNDAPALAQADVGVAMNSGTQAAKEAANMVDLDSDPTKLLEVVEVGKQLLMTRGCLTTFSIANDIAKYFAILPALFIPAFPQISALNVMGLSSPYSAILSAVIFNALIIIALIPLALKGVKYRATGASSLLKRSLLIYGLGGVIVPFAGIKAIDVLLTLIGLS